MAVTGGVSFNNNLVGFRQVIGDFARSFMFKMSVPAWNANNSQLSIFARSITLPAFKLHSEQIGFQGLKMNVITTAEFNDPWTVKILADENQVIRSNIMKWMSVAYDAGTMEASTLKDYKKDNYFVQQLDRVGKIVSTYKFYGIYPESVSSPTLAHDTVTPQDFDVTFKYDFFTFNLGDEKVIDMKADNEVPAIRGDNLVVGSNNTAPKQASQNGNLVKSIT